jgi:ankyrin repeat protein
MSDAIPLPPRPDIDHYRKLAKDLQRACRSGSGGSAAVHEWARHWIEALTRLPGVAAEPAAIDHTVRDIERRWAKWATPERIERCLLTDAQYFVALEHGFASWPKFVNHLAGLSDTSSPIFLFEAATDAIVAGDVVTLRALLRAHPELARARSTREHHSTLLHYVSANGVEHYRQKTPANIVELTQVLIEAGADVNAESNAYGGGSTALGLTATSIHPENAGVQTALLELLLGAGATTARDLTIRGCLANGQGDAARFFADRGLPMDLEEAAGVGRLDVVRRYIDADGTLRNGATQEQLESGFRYACGFGHIDVATFLLDGGVDPNVANEEGQTALHWTAFGPHLEVARLLLARGARREVRDRHSTTPLDCATRMLPWRTEAAARRRGEELVRLFSEET